MNRNKLVLSEIITTILICLCILFMIFNVYFIIKNSGKSVLKINETNRKIVEDMLKESKYYSEINNYSEVNKIQYWLDFNDYQFTLYYNNGTEKQIYDDGLDNLREYIQKKGIDKGILQIIYGLGTIFLTSFLNSIRKNISNKIEYMDKKEERDNNE
ncbi:MAG: hypothetical protein ILA02_07475 [Clostridia bacterium]|nr:hypothetical protein [Clostridia bacterium]